MSDEETTSADDPIDSKLLEQAPVMQAPRGFADRVAAAHLAEREEQDAEVVAPPGLAGLAQEIASHRFVAYAAAVVAVGVVALFVHVGLNWGTDGAADTGSLAPSSRTTASIASRGVVVAEAGSVLAWSVSSGGDTQVEQKMGNVFYRVEAGGDFVVHSPVGDVRVEGTCFRVEIETMKPSKQNMIGAAVGAALAASVVVTVYEGKVIFADKSRPQGAGREVVAGETLRIGAGGESTDAPEHGNIVFAPPPEGATLDDLLERDKTLRGEVDRLRGEVEKLSSTRRVVKIGPESSDDDGRPWFDPSKARLEEMAEQCRMGYDLPPPLPGTPADVGPRLAQKMGLSASEGIQLANIMAKVNESLQLEVRGLYLEATGDEKGADELSVQAMGQEMNDKSERGAMSRVTKRLAGERAGLVRPRKSPADGSPLERYYRLLSGVGDAVEHELAAVVGAERARQVRAEAGGWGQRMEVAGCPEADDASIDEDVVR